MLFESENTKTSIYDQIADLQRKLQLLGKFVSTRRGSDHLYFIHETDCNNLYELTLRAAGQRATGAPTMKALSRPWRRTARTSCSYERRTGTWRRGCRKTKPWGQHETLNVIPRHPHWDNIDRNRLSFPLQDEQQFVQSALHGRGVEKDTGPPMSGKVVCTNFECTWLCCHANINMTSKSKIPHQIDVDLMSRAHWVKIPWMKRRHE